MKGGKVSKAVVTSPAPLRLKSLGLRHAGRFTSGWKCTASKHDGNQPVGFG